MSGFSLHGKRVLVTGANTGIGQGIALAMGQAGAEILAAGRSSMEDTAAAFRRDAPTARLVPVQVDLADVGQGPAMLDRVWEEYGPIDALVNNAGIIRRADAVDFTEADWDDVVDLNLKSVFFLSQAFARRVLGAGRRGKLINIASMLSFQGGIRVASYTASKSGVAGLTRLLACEWAGRGINVNAIAPGYIETNNTAGLREDARRSAQILDRIPAGRWGRPEDIGASAVYLAAPASDYVHGTVLAVDGGWLAR
ncbi:MAG: 2-dehydro-3-deoxy-D-gluconate 5-dehydrogenase KduD [Acetobacteraceae bacterium]|nr:MAG: 2-dehydro-3-deoxy-D-gluconate 5-dehydrogenase KduD [Acetobacteraceae bacterium]